LLTIPLLKIRRIVVLTKAGLGDAVYVVPALRALRCHFAQAQITLIASQRGYPLLSRCPYADRIYQSYLGSGALGKAREVLRLIRGRYDLAVVLDASVEKILFTYLARIRYRAGCANKGGGKYLTHAATIPDDAHQISDLNRAVLHAIGCPTDDWRLELFPDPQAEASLCAKLRQVGWRGQRPLVGLNVGASAPNKRWYPNRYAQVADALAGSGACILLIGAESDLAAIEATQRAMRHPALSLGGQLSLDELIFLLQRLDVLISGDTGPAHLAAAVGTPVVGLFGPSRAQHYAPLGTQHILIDRSHLCAPTCSFWTCRGDNHACMRAITVDEVLAAARRILQCRPTPVVGDT
jgi:lipopolysaccharide heptosyltransferase II